MGGPQLARSLRACVGVCCGPPVTSFGRDPDAGSGLCPDGPGQAGPGQAGLLALWQTAQLQRRLNLSQRFELDTKSPHAILCNTFNPPTDNRRIGPLKNSIVMMCAALVVYSWHWPSASAPPPRPRARTTTTISPPHRHHAPPRAKFSPSDVNDARKTNRGYARPKCGEDAEKPASVSKACKNHARTLDTSCAQVSMSLHRVKNDQCLGEPAPAIRPRPPPSALCGLHGADRPHRVIRIYAAVGLLGGPPSISPALARST
jgi:hypothetical protein